MTEKKIGFIILRNVNSVETNEYWLECYRCIRNHYPENKIVIIDDSSDYNYITDKVLYKTIIINGEYPKRGELLPYYYYLQNKFFETAVILHDSVFVNQYVDFDTKMYKFIWDFSPSKWDKIEEETKILKVFDDNELIKFYQNKKLWRGCFGCMSVINHEILVNVDQKYKIEKLLNLIVTRKNRESLERVLACLFQKCYPEETLLGDINEYCLKKMGGGKRIFWKDKDKFNHLPLTKIFTGR